MKIVVYVILVPLAVILFCAFIFASFKAFFRLSKEKLQLWWMRKRDGSAKKDAEITDPAGMVETVTLTAGTCDCCGRTFIGTTSDEESQLQIVKFMGVSKNICKDCLKRLFDNFNREKGRGETLYSENAKKLKDMLEKMDKNESNSANSSQNSHT